MPSWDYLIVTASHDSQAQAYEQQLALRRDLGMLDDLRHVLVVPDPGGRRIGSGGSTLWCLREVLQREQATDPQATLSQLRILIVHAGGDSKRLPAYSPCGKIFVPVPGNNDSGLPLTLFDVQLPRYLALPAAGQGQVVVTAGDVLLRFDPSEVRFAPEGMTALGCYADPKEASAHGVICRGPDQTVWQFLQKPSPAQQEHHDAINAYGQSILDAGIMSFDARTATLLLKTAGLPAADGTLEFSGPIGGLLLEKELDFFREICCAMGSHCRLETYLHGVKDSGSTWDEARLGLWFAALQRTVPFDVHVLSQCDFLHFGTTRQLISSGNTLVQFERLNTAPRQCLSLNNQIRHKGEIAGASSWVEGCIIEDKLTCAGHNSVVGAIIGAPISLPQRLCLDVTYGKNRQDQGVFFVRCYDVLDKLNGGPQHNATFCGRSIGEWLAAVGADESALWDSDIPDDQRNLWNARLFPAVAVPPHLDIRDWLWLFNPEKATPEEHQRWLQADRYSSQEIAQQADQTVFHGQRTLLRSIEIESELRQLFRRSSRFSAQDLRFCLKQNLTPLLLIQKVLQEACWNHNQAGSTLDGLTCPRILHSLGTALCELKDQIDLDELKSQLPPSLNQWLNDMGLAIGPHPDLSDWTRRLRQQAFTSASRAILAGQARHRDKPSHVLRSDEIVWGRAPARFDTGGGWTDTPPYALEYGGCVVNTAIDLNGQPPIQAYLRIMPEPVIRIGSIDLGTRIEITELEDLLDYHSATSEYGLVKAALALAGFAPERAPWKNKTQLTDMLKSFGGGIEITTLAAIPKGSGLGTSSIMGAVILGVIGRAMGQRLSHRELFHQVLCLEQLLTTGGGWQDQIGGVTGGAKRVTTQAGLIPDPTLHYLPSDLLDPSKNGGTTLLYYTGITRLAKNILAQVVGRYLDRDRQTLSTLQQIAQCAQQTAEALAQKDLTAFGHLVARAWELNKQLDPNSTNDEVEELMQRIAPHIHGAKLLGAGGGGFLLMVCKSPEHTHQLKQDLQQSPGNARARFFAYSINNTGLTVTAC